MKQNFKKNFPQLFVIIALLAISLFAIIGNKLVPIDATPYEYDNRTLDLEWSIVNEDTGENESVSLPLSSPKGKTTTTTIETQLPEVEDNTVLCLRPDQVDIKVYIDGVLRTEYSSKDVRFFGRVSARRYIFLELQDTDSGKTLTTEITNPVAGEGSFTVKEYGRKYDVVLKMLKDSAPDLIVAFVMLVICIIAMIASIVISVSFKHFFEMTYLTIMGILASVWILCNSEVSQFLFRNSSISISIDYMMLMMLPFPFLFFMNRIQNYHFDRLYRIFEYAAMVETVVCTVLQLTNVKDFGEMFFAIAGVFGCSLIMILVTIIIDIFARGNRDYLIVAIGIYAGVIATLVQFGLFLSGTYSFGGKAVGIALLIILLTSVIDTFKKLYKMESDKQAAVALGKAESTFLANMSHEIRTPINSVLGMNEMILRETDEANIRDYSENIERSGNLLLSIVNDILDFSKIRSGKMNIIAVNYSLYLMLEDIVKMTGQRAVDKNLEFRIEIDEQLPDGLLGDSGRIKQVIINLLTNSVKYTEKGYVLLKIEGERPDNDKAEADDTVILKVSVKDSGKGIKKEDQATLFDAFSRADEKNNRNIEGTGLGLALVSNFVNAMNGEVGVESVYGEGSTFTVTIPQKIVDSKTYATAKAEKIAESEAAAKEAAAKKLAAGTAAGGENEKTADNKNETGSTAAAGKVLDKSGKACLIVAPEARVLIVDDTAMNLKVIKNLLKRTQIDVTLAGSGEEGLEIMKNEVFDVVFIDHQMPVMDGEEMLHNIKNAGLEKGATLVALTANAIEGSRERYLGMGFDDYLSKPVRSEELETMLVKYVPESKQVK